MISGVRFRAGSGTRKSGVVELQYNGVWLPICNRYFYDYNADILCKELGFGYDERTSISRDLLTWKISYMKLHIATTGILTYFWLSILLIETHLKALLVTMWNLGQNSQCFVNKFCVFLDVYMLFNPENSFFSGGNKGTSVNGTYSQSYTLSCYYNQLGLDGCSVYVENYCYTYSNISCCKSRESLYIDSQYHF